MRPIIAILTFLVVGAGSAVGQNFEVRLISGIGIAPSNLDSKSDWIEFENHSHLIPIGLDANYFFLPEKRINFFLGTGFEYSNNSYFQNIKHLDYGYNLQSIRFSQKHLGIPLRIGSEWKIFNSNSLGFQCELQYNFAMKREVVISPKNFASDPSINLKYSYSLTNRAKNFLSKEISLYLKTQIAKNLYLISSVDFEFRPSSGSYDFRTDQIKTNTNAQVEASYAFEKEEIKNNILGFKLALTKYF
ncbi:MAG: hypothetical protein H6563_11805 [Lewinellaceae bacterium]|nr:hypothetical protein [Lewinellaceae bacterium]